MSLSLFHMSSWVKLRLYKIKPEVFSLIISINQRSFTEVLESLPRASHDQRLDSATSLEGNVTHTTNVYKGTSLLQYSQPFLHFKITLVILKKKKKLQTQGLDPRGSN